MNNPDLISCQDIANMLGLSYRHVLDRITKRPTFPPPFWDGKNKLWEREKVIKHLREKSC